jgi:AraC-like DNA-binding protein
MNRYGIDNFYIEELEHCDKDKLDEREIFWISHYKSNDKNFGYSMTAGGGGGDTWTNNPNKELTIKKLRAANTGKKRSAEFSRHMSEVRKGSYFIDIDNDRLLESIQDGKTLKELCGIYHVSYRTLLNRFRVAFGGKIREFRNENFIRRPVCYSEVTRDRLCKIRRENFSGSKNPNYKEVDADILYKLVKENRSVDELIHYFGISKTTLYAKIKQYFGTTLRELRKEMKNDY